MYLVLSLTMSFKLIFLNTNSNQLYNPKSKALYTETVYHRGSKALQTELFAICELCWKLFKKKKRLESNIYLLKALVKGFTGLTNTIEL